MGQLQLTFSQLSLYSSTQSYVMVTWSVSVLIHSRSLAWLQPLQSHLSKQSHKGDSATGCSVTEVEVVVSVGVILALAEHGAHEVESGWHPGDAEPDTETVVEHDTLDEELSESAEHEVVEPLLSGVRSVVEDVATSIR